MPIKAPSLSTTGTRCQCPLHIARATSMSGAAAATDVTFAVRPAPQSTPERSSPPVRTDPTWSGHRRATAPRQAVFAVAGSKPHRLRPGRLSRGCRRTCSALRQPVPRFFLSVSTAVSIVSNSATTITFFFMMSRAVKVPILPGNFDMDGLLKVRVDRALSASQYGDRGFSVRSPGPGERTEHDCQNLPHVQCECKYHRRVSDSPVC